MKISIKLSAVLAHGSDGFPEFEHVHSLLETQSRIGILSVTERILLEMF